MTPLSSGEIKRIKSLGAKKFRDSLGLFAVEGEKLVREALDSSFEVVKVYRASEIGQEAMSRISSLTTPSPVLAVVRIPEDVPELAPENPGKGLFLALDSIRDPGNLGTIIRTADWFGIDGIYASPDTVDVFNPKVVQATMGAIFRVPFKYASIPSLCKAAALSGGRVYGTFLDGSDIFRSPLDAGKDAASIIVIGNESRGISPEVAAQTTDRLLIPRFAGRKAESLNAAVAASLAMCEFRRRENA